LLVACCPARAADDVERDRALLGAAQACARQLPGALVTGIRNGAVELQITDRGDAASFDRCFQDAAPRALKALAVGRLAENAAETSATIETVGSMIFVPVLVNGSKGRLLLDTGATKTIIRPMLAQLAGIEPGREAPEARMTVAGGGQLSVPLVRARSLAIDRAEVHAIEIGVYDATPDLPDVDGILGTDFLGHFTVTIDRQSGTLLLAPQRR
jgi:predicted aspartyl protease